MQPRKVCSVPPLLVLLVLLSAVWRGVRSQGETPTGLERPVESSFTIGNLKFYTDFLDHYTEQWTFRRITFVYAYKIATEDNRENVRIYQAEEERNFNFIDMTMSRNYSRRGISVNSLHLPLKLSGRTAADMLRLRDPLPQPPVTLILFSLESYYASFIKEVAEAGGMIGSQLAWIIIANNHTKALSLLTLDLGLRSDSRVMSVDLSKDGPNTISIWTGSSMGEAHGNDGTGLNFKAEHSLTNMNIDLEGQTISVAIFADAPFVYFDSKKGTVKGWFVDIWQELQERLRFNTTYYYPNRNSQSGGLFRRAIEELRLGRADVVIGAFAMTPMSEIEFSRPVTTLSYRFYVKRTITTSSFAQFIQPFQWRLWASICGTVSILAVGMAFTYLVGRRFGVEDPKGPPMFNVRESALTIFGSPLQQGPDFLPNGIGAALVLWISYIFGLVVFTAYGAALISKLTVRALDPPFTSLAALLADSYYVLHVQPDSAPHRLMSGAEQGVWRELRDRRPPYVVAETLQSSLNLVSVDSKTVLLASRERVGPLIQGEPLNCQLAQINRNILRTGGRFLLQKNSHIKAAIDLQLNQMWSTGRLMRWRERWLASVKDNPCPTDTKLVPFGMEQVALPFLILASGMAGALLFLGAEKTFKRLFPDLEQQRQQKGGAAGGGGGAPNLQRIASLKRQARLRKKKKVDVMRNPPVRTFLQ